MDGVALPIWAPPGSVTPQFFVTQSTLGQKCTLFQDLQAVRSIQATLKRLQVAEAGMPLQKEGGGGGMLVDSPNNV